MEYLFSISFFVVIVLSILSVKFLKNEIAKKIILNLLALILVVWKITEFTIYYVNNTHVYPIEFSHLSYFIVSLIILSQCKKMYFTGGIFSLISGIGYGIAAICFPLGIINSNELNVVIMGFISHSLLFFLGVQLCFNTIKFNYKDLYIPCIFFILVVVYESLIINGIIFKDLSSPDSYVIIMLLEGRILEYIDVDPSNYWLNYSATILIYLLVIGLVLLINYLNNLVFKKRNKNTKVS